MDLFNQFRPRDINIEAAVSDEARLLDFYVFNEGALNTFSASLAQSYIDGGYKLIKMQKLSTRKLCGILLENIQNMKIDFMTIDVEGCELNVLKSNDWSLFKPDYLLIEQLDNESIQKTLTTEINKYLGQNGYSIFAKTFNTVFYKSK